MANVEKLLIEYRDVLRQLWNRHFSQRVDRIDECGALDDFEVIDRHLFSGLVLSNLGDAYWRQSLQSFRRKPIPFITVRPRGRAPNEILVAKPGQNRQWVKRPDITDWSKLIASFVEVFDFGMYKDQVDFAYYVGEIKEFAGHDDLKGWYCLLRIDDANVSAVDLGKEKKRRTKSVTRTT